MMIQAKLPSVMQLDSDYRPDSLQAPDFAPIAVTLAVQPPEQLTAFQQVSLAKLFRAVGSALSLGLPIGLVWAVFMQSFMLPETAGGIDIWNYYAFWVLFGSSLSVALLAPRELAGRPIS